MTLTVLDYPKATIRMAVTTDIEKGYRARACAKEPWTTEWVEGMKRGDVLWDVGANVGSYSLLAAALGHTVIAVEPGESNFAAIIQNINLQPAHTGPRILALNAALGATNGLIPFTQQAAPGFGEGGAVTREVQQVTLDSLVASGLPCPTHLKVDVDGHELGVLTGAEQTLCQPTPLRSVLVEVIPGKTSRKVKDEMAMFGWRWRQMWNERGGQRMRDVAYLLFERVRPLEAAA